MGRARLRPGLMVALAMVACQHEPADDRSVASQASALSGTPRQVNPPAPDRSPGQKRDVKGGVNALGAVAAWTDSRKPGVTTVVATRITADAGAIDPIGIELGTGYIGGLAAGSSTVLVTAFQNGGVNAYRIHPQTGLVSPTPTPVTVAANNTGPVAWNGTSWWLTWTIFGGVVGVRLDTDGGVLDAAPLMLHDAGVNELRLARQPVGSDNLFASFENPGNTVKAWWVHADGGLTAGGVMALGAGALAGSLEVATSASDGLVSWVMNDGGSGGHLIGARVAPAGKIDAVALELMPDAGVFQASTALGHDGSRYRVAFTGAGAQLPFEARLDPGTMQPALVAPLGFFRGDSDDWQIDSVPGVSAWLFDHTHAFLSYYPLRASRLDADGGLAPGPNAFTICRGFAGQQNPVVTAMGGQWLAAWQELRNQTYDIYATVLDGTGQPTRAAVALDQPFAFSSFRPKVAAGPSAGWVAWVDNSQFRATQLPADGGMPASVPISLNVTFTDGAGIAWDGQRYAVAFASSGKVFFRRFDPTGAPFDGAPVTVDTVGPSFRDVEVAYGNSQYLVVWSTYGATFGVRVSSAGAVLDAVPLMLGESTSAVHVAVTGTGFDVTCGGGFAAIDVGVATARVDLDGGVFALPGILADAGPNAAAVGSSAALGTWVALHAQLAPGSTGTVLGRWLGDGGIVWAAAPLALDSAQYGLGSAVAGSASGDVLVAYTHWFPATASTQIWAQVLSPLANGATCTADFDCASAWCNGGVCRTPQTVDAGAPDAGAVDAGGVDAGVVDAGGVDAGQVDAGPPDAGGVDAGPPDAGPVDAGVPDSGVGGDGGVIDSGVPDAGPGLRTFGAGCGCNGASGLAAPALLALLRVRRRVSASRPVRTSSRGT